jgi:hypothetical protein
MTVSARMWRRVLLQKFTSVPVERSAYIFYPVYRTSHSLLSSKYTTFRGVPLFSSSRDWLQSYRDVFVLRYISSLYDLDSDLAAVTNVRLEVFMVFFIQVFWAVTSCSLTCKSYRRNVPLPSSQSPSEWDTYVLHYTIKLQEPPGKRASTLYLVHRSHWP